MNVIKKEKPKVRSKEEEGEKFARKKKEKR